MRSFIIHLSKIDSSFTSAIETRQSLANIGIDAELFEGTYGNDAVEIFNKEDRMLHPNIFNLDNFKQSSPGVMGCFYSHYRLWQHCIELNEPIMIFEDDVKICRNFHSIEFDDVLVLSINYDWKIIDFLKIYLEETHSLSTVVEYNNFHMPGASGYAINPSAAKKLVDTYKQSYLPADWAINSNICKITIHPQLIGRSKTMAEKASLTRLKTWIK